MNGWREECLRRFKQTQKYNNYDKEDLVEELIEKEQELQRKDNIINELKECLKEKKEYSRYQNDVERFTAYEYVLDKIKELESK